jgi:Mg-chelatase subunit ChlD
MQLSGTAVLILLLGLIYLAAYEGLLFDSKMKWVTFAWAVCATVATAGAAYFRQRLWQLVVFLAVSLLTLVLYSSGQYITSDPRGLTLFKQPVAVILNYGMLVCLLGFAGLIWLGTKLPWKLRLILTTLPIYAGSAFAYSAINGLGVEETFLGMDAFAVIPYYFLQPSYIAMNVLFPIGLVWSLAYCGVLGKTPPYSLFAQALALLFVGFTISGFFAMHRNRVPNLLSLIRDPKPGVGEATVTFTYPGGQNKLMRIATKDFAQHKFDEEAVFYNMALSYRGSEAKRHLFDLSVKDSLGQDVLFLDKNDFDIFEDNQPSKAYDINFQLGGVRSRQNVILLLDHSNSMKGFLDDLKLAAVTFVNLKKFKDKIVVVPFAGSVTPHPISDQAEQLKQYISKMQLASYTALYQAILKAYELGEKLDGLTSIVVMTDGDPTDETPQRKRALAQKLEQNRFKVFSVGLGDKQYFDESFLRNLSEKGGGKYYHAAQAEQLSSVYKAISAELNSQYTAWYRESTPAPRLEITYPKEEDVLTDPLEMLAVVHNAREAQLTQVAFYLDNKLVDQIPYTGTRTFSFRFDPQDYPFGKHQLRVVAKGQPENVSAESTEVNDTPRKKVRHKITPPPDLNDPSTVEETRSFATIPAVELHLLRPRDGDSVGETVKIEAELLVRGDRKGDMVRFEVDGRPLAEAVKAPYQATWSTNDAAAGKHHISAYASISDGRDISDQVTVNLAREMSIRLAGFEDGAELKPTIPLRAFVTDNASDDPITTVTFSANQKTIGTVSKAPFEMVWQTTHLSFGRYIVSAEGVSQSGKKVNAALSGKISQGGLMVDLNVKDQFQKTQRETARDRATKVLLSPENIEIVLDASNSMWGQLSQGSKIEIAKQVLHRVIRRMPQHTNVALRVYGNGSHVKEQNCRDSELLVPLKQLDQFELLNRIHTIVPRGKTPIAYSLAYVRKDLQGARGTRVVLLITDGIESCNGDPVAAAKQLSATAGVETILHVIGYDVADDMQQRLLKEIAQAGGGAFFPADSPEQLSHAIVKATTIGFKLRDSQGKIVLTHEVGSKVHKLRPGAYSVEIDLPPKLVKQRVVVSADRTATVLVGKVGNRFRFE